MDFFDNGHLIVALLDAEYVMDAWSDIDQDAITKILADTDTTPWIRLPLLDTPKFRDFIDEVDKVRNESVYSRPRD